MCFCIFVTLSVQSPMSTAINVNLLDLQTAFKTGLRWSFSSTWSQRDLFVQDTGEYITIALKINKANYDEVTPQLF